LTSTIVQVIGYSAQAIFGMRFFVQLWYSEKSGKVQSPSLFWQLSLVASALLLIYSILVKDLPIMLGQILGYFIYIRNLHISRVWYNFHSIAKIIILLLPAISLLIILSGHQYSLEGIIDNNSNVWLLLWGLTGQLVFTSRFIYQWIYSEKKQESLFPPAFWVISITGALLISSYAFYLHLYPIIIGHTFGMIVYVRNLMIHHGIMTHKRDEII